MVSRGGLQRSEGCKCLKASEGSWVSNVERVLKVLNMSSRF